MTLRRIEYKGFKVMQNLQAIENWLESMLSEAIVIEPDLDCPPEAVSRSIQMAMIAVEEARGWIQVGQ